MSAAGKFHDELIATAQALSAPGKGLLAADESTGTIGKRFAGINVENKEENRRNYRELLFSTPGDWGKFISGVILYEETLKQKGSNGKPLVDLLKAKQVIPGIKTDMGLVVIPGTDGEQATQGLTGLAGRCEDYYKLGARFSKWRNVIKITDKCPSPLAVQEVAHTLARQAAISQANGLCPIVEPEVLMEGSHSIERCQEVTERVLAAVFKALNDHNVLLEGCLLKPNMVTPGQENPAFKTVSPQEIAKATVTALQRTVPPALPGIMFLSGGQSEEQASVNLNAINQHAGPKPWSLTFSYGRALQATVLKTWKGDSKNVEAAQKAFLHRAEANSLAQLGKYSGSDVGKESLYEKGYKY